MMAYTEDTLELEQASGWFYGILTGAAVWGDGQSQAHRDADLPTLGAHKNGPRTPSAPIVSAKGLNHSIVMG